MKSALATIGTVIALALSGAEAQSVDNRGCLRLLGSAACPAFSYAYINPSNLTNAFPWMANVNSVQTFDTAVFNYLSNPDQWETTKFQNQLGCSNATNAVIRWERTVLCSKWVNEQWSLACTAYYNGTSAATSSKMVCQDTCLQYSASETQLVNSTTYCPGPDRTNGNRSYWLNKDFVDCTNWTTLATNDSMSCVSGASNEGNCGYGSSTAQLCNFCSGNNPSDCCYSSNTDVSVCGFALPARTTSTSLSPSAASTASAASSSAASASAAQAGTAGNNAEYVGNTGLTKGQLAGTIVGSVLGGLLLLALLGFLLFFCCFRKGKRSRRDSASTFPAPPTAGEGAAAGTGAGMFGLFGGVNGGKNGAGPNASEKGLLQANHSQPAHNGSSPTMGGDTLYSGRGIGSTGALSALSGGAAGAGTGAGAAAASGARPYSTGSGGDGAAAAGTAAGVGGAAGLFAGGAIKGERTSGNVLPRVRDENQGGNRWIETGADVTVLWPYSASLPDELDLRPGMKIRVLRLYDDAWGTGQVLSGGDADEIGKQGAFPIVCVSEGSTLASGASSTDSH